MHVPSRHASPRPTTSNLFLNAATARYATPNCQPTLMRSPRRLLGGSTGTAGGGGTLPARLPTPEAGFGLAGLPLAACSSSSSNSGPRQRSHMQKVIRCH